MSTSEWAVQTARDFFRTYRSPDAAWFVEEVLIPGLARAFDAAKGKGVRHSAQEYADCCAALRYETEAGEALRQQLRRRFTERDILATQLDAVNVALGGAALIEIDQQIRTQDWRLQKIAHLKSEGAREALGTAKSLCCAECLEAIEDAQRLAARARAKGRHDERAEGAGAMSTSEWARDVVERLRQEDCPHYPDFFCVNCILCVADAFDAAKAEGRAEGYHNWKPTTEEINGLPEPLRAFIHLLETRCDPAGELRELVFARDIIQQLRTKVKGAKAEGAREAIGALMPHTPGHTVSTVEGCPGCAADEWLHARAKDQ